MFQRKQSHRYTMVLKSQSRVDKHDNQSKGGGEACGRARRRTKKERQPREKLKTSSIEWVVVASSANSDYYEGGNGRLWPFACDAMVG